MVDFVVWGMADPLTVEQAACLWAGYDPSSSMQFRPQAERAAIEPLFQMLTGAIASGELQADSDSNPLRIIGKYDKSLLKRIDLMAFAESWSAGARASGPTTSSTTSPTSPSP